MKVVGIKSFYQVGVFLVSAVFVGLFVCGVRR